MVFEFDFEKNLAEYKRVYKDFLLPVVICDSDFEVRWRNLAAEDLFPQLGDAQGVRRLLGEFDADELLAGLGRDGVRRIDGTLAFSGVRLNITPVMQDGAVGGVMIMLVGPQAVVSRQDIIESSKTPENIEACIRAGVAEIFDFMDESAKKSAWIGDGAMLPGFAGIERSGYRLLRIAANISNYARFQVDPPRPSVETLDVFDFIRKSRSAVTAYAEETGIEVGFGMPGGNVPSVAAIDAKHLQLAYSNLINNALYFTKAGGVVEIEGRADSDWISFTVRDSGVGIPAHLLPDTVFKPYFSYARDGKPSGIGLGLALVRMIADGCGGKVSIESVENEGSAATFTLPNRAFGASLSFKQETMPERTGGYDDRFSYASVSLRAAADSPYRKD